MTIHEIAQPSAQSMAPFNPLEVEFLQRYHLAKERAARANRNLLQYCAAIATVLGIGLGSGSLFALAGSVAGVSDAEIPVWLITALLVQAGVVGSIVSVLFLMVCRALGVRGAAERGVDESLSRLIAIDPDRFSQPHE